MSKFTGITWRVITPKKSLLWPKSEVETWLLNPPLRYVITSDCQHQVSDDLEAYSDLKGTKYYRPLSGLANLANGRLLVERHRDRGIGDLLFTTGPLAYLQHVNSHGIKIFYAAPVDKGLVLHGNQNLANELPVSGPVVYDTLPLYTAHWFIEAATEYDEEPDQANVYDVLYNQIGIDPVSVDAKFKRPVISAFKADSIRADDFFRLIFYERNEDWRKTPYWIVSPLTHSSLRSANYGMWLNVINELSKTAHVLVIGQVLNGMMPDTDTPFSEFYSSVHGIASSNRNVINLIGKTPMRLTIGLIAGSAGVITLDSGLLYIAQGLRVPAISLWGPQHPRTRIGYDQNYMDLAIWAKTACDYAPCFAYRSFPTHKCPAAGEQHVCAPLAAITSDMVLSKVEVVRSRSSAAETKPLAKG